MDIVLLVAIDAVERCLSPRLTALVAPVARQSTVRAFEREVRQAMIELSGTQLHDVGLAALVFSVARTALPNPRVRHAAMIAAMFLQVFLDLLVTIQTQCRLWPDVGAVVTVGTSLLLLDMGTRHRARHQQCFDRYSKGTRCTHA